MEHTNFVTCMHGEGFFEISSVSIDSTVYSGEFDASTRQIGCCQAASWQTEITSQTAGLFSSASNSYHRAKQVSHDRTPLPVCKFCHGVLPGNEPHQIF